MAGRTLVARKVTSQKGEEDCPILCPPPAYFPSGSHKEKGTGTGKDARILDRL